MSCVSAVIFVSVASNSLHRDGAAHQVFVVIQQFDRQVTEGERPAQQDVIRLALIVGQREGRVLLQLHVAFDQQRLATAALPFLASVHHRDALAESGIEHGLAFRDLHLDADRLEPHCMNCLIIDCFRHGAVLPLHVAHRALLIRPGAGVAHYLRSLPDGIASVSSPD